jgi:hypothetical protein
VPLEKYTISIEIITHRFIEAAIVHPPVKQDWRVPGPYWRRIIPRRTANITSVDLDSVILS